MRLVTLLRLVAVSSLVLACQSESFERFAPAGDGISFRAPAGWDHRRDRATSVFSARAPGLERTTIAVRALPIRASERRWRDRQAIGQATKAVLASLPEARVAGPVPASHPRFSASSFALRFVSRDSGEAYERRHLVLVSREGGRVIHVFHTAPVGTLARSAAVFDELVKSLKEEG